MNFLSRLILFLVVSVSLSAPAGAAVPVMATGSACDAVAADDDKKPEGDEKPEGEEAEPDCE